MSWTEGYISGIDYTHGYYRELSPVYARLPLVNRGIRTVGLKNPRYLELGFGLGLSINIHAAASPGEYWGTDFNPAQAAEAREISEACGNGARLFDDSFEELAARSDLPEFDVIALHGIWSWISEVNRQQIVEIARRKLKPGGVLYISYNVTPGWSAVAPMRHLLTLHASRSGGEAGGIIRRIDGAIEFANKVAGAGALYFKKNPGVLDRLKNLEDRNRNYVAHEYFNSEWDPMPFSRVAEALDEAKLSFGVAAHCLDHLDGIHLSQEAQKLMREIADPVLQESVRDYFVNNQFRRDYFVRGIRRMPTPAQTDELKSLRAVLGRPTALVGLEVKGALGKATLHEQVYRPVIEALGADGMRPKTFAEIGEAAQAKDIPFSQVVQALVVLVGKGDVYLAQEEDVVRSVKECTAQLNRHLISRARFDGEILTLASPVTGGGVSMSRLEQLFMLSLADGGKEPDDWARSAWKMLSAQGHRMIKDGKTLESADDNLAQLTKEAHEWKDTKLPIVRLLGIVD